MAKVLQFPSRPVPAPELPELAAWREQFILEHMHVVRSIARGIARRGIPTWVELDDVEQQGMIGLIAASKSYNRALNVPPESWARLKVRGYILTYLREQYEHRETVELDEAPEPSFTPHDQVDEDMTTATDAGRVLEAAEYLPPRERRIVHLIYVEDRSMREIAEAWDCSTQQISLLHRRALAALRSRLVRHAAVA